MLETLARLKRTTASLWMFVSLSVVGVHGSFNPVLHTLDPCVYTRGVPDHERLDCDAVGGRGVGVEKDFMSRERVIFMTL